MRCSKCYNEIPNESKICPICQNIFANYFEDIELTKQQKIKLFLHKALFPIILIITIIITITTIFINQKIKLSRITDINKINVTKENYINELYKSDGRYYKYILNKTEKEIYNEIFNAIKNNQEQIEIDIKKYNITSSYLKTKTIKKINNVLTSDHPELINYSFISIDTKDKVIIKPNYTFDHHQQDEIIATIKEELEEIKETTTNMQEYEKIKYVYEYINKTIKLTDKKDAYTKNAYGCFIKKECNSQGLAKTVQIIFNNININSILTTGIKQNKYEEWNIVKVGKKYYYYDQAQSYQEPIYNGLLFTSKEYTPYYKKLIPPINKTKYIQN